MFDVIIRGGTLLDGTGAPEQREDIAVSGDRIAEIGDLSSAMALETVDAAGLIVCPGFVDPHNHAFNQHRGGITRIPEADNLVRQGVTTVLSGACGTSGYPVGEHLEEVEAQRFHCNYAAMVGYNTIKSLVLSNARRNPSRAEMAEISARLTEGMDEGAFGVTATPHGRSQDVMSTEELIAAASAVAGQGGFYHSHIRDEGEWGGHMAALGEVVRVAREAGVPALSSHIKLWGTRAWGDAEEVDALFHAARAEGLDVHADMYAYTGGYRGLGGLVSDVRERMSREELLQQPPRRDVADAIRDQLEQIGGPGNVILCPADGNPSLNGKTLQEAAWERDSSVPATALELLEQGSVQCCWLAMREEDVAHFLSASYTMVGTDAHLRVPNDGHCHPRNYGNYARFLGEWVRERRVLSLSEVIHKMTECPAKKIGLRDRGLLCRGAFADIAIFCPQSVADNATWDRPHVYPSGIPHVLVNGRFAVRDGKTTDALPGRVLRRND